MQVANLSYRVTQIKILSTFFHTQRTYVELQLNLPYAELGNLSESKVFDFCSFETNSYIKSRKLDIDISQIFYRKTFKKLSIRETLIIGVSQFVN